MPVFASLTPARQSRVVTDVFRGYDHRPRIPDGSFYNTQNLSARHYPLLSTRLPRAVAGQLQRPGGLLEKDALCWVDAGTLYVNGAATALTGRITDPREVVGLDTAKEGA